MSLKEVNFQYCELFWHFWTIRIATQGTNSILIKLSSQQKKPKIETLQPVVKAVVMENN